MTAFSRRFSSALQLVHGTQQKHDLHQLRPKNIIWGCQAEADRCCPAYQGVLRIFRREREGPAQFADSQAGIGSIKGLAMIIMPTLANFYDHHHVWHRDNSMNRFNSGSGNVIQTRNRMPLLNKWKFRRRQSRIFTIFLLVIRNFIAVLTGKNVYTRKPPLITQKSMACYLLLFTPFCA